MTDAATDSRDDIYRRTPLKRFAAKVGRSEAFLYRLCRSGQLAHFKEGNRTLCTLADWYQYSRREAQPQDAIVR